MRSDLARWSSRCFDRTQSIWPKHRLLQLMISLPTALGILVLTGRDLVEEHVVPRPKLSRPVIAPCLHGFRPSTPHLVQVSVPTVVCHAARVETACGAADAEPLVEVSASHEQDAEYLGAAWASLCGRGHGRSHRTYLSRWGAISPTGQPVLRRVANYLAEVPGDEKKN